MALFKEYTCTMTFCLHTNYLHFSTQNLSYICLFKIYNYIWTYQIILCTMAFLHIYYVQYLHISNLYTSNIFLHSSYSDSPICHKHHRHEYFYITHTYIYYYILLYQIIIQLYFCISLYYILTNVSYHYITYYICTDVTPV